MSFKIAEAFVEVVLKDNTEGDLAAIKAKLSGVEPAKLKVDADTGEAESKVAAVQAKLDRLKASDASPKVTADVADAQVKLLAISSRLDELRAKESSPKVDADVAAAEAKLAALDAQLDGLGAKGDSSGLSLGGIGKWAAIGLGGIAPLAATGAAALAAIGPAALGAGAALAGIGMAFSGISAALKGHTADQQAAASASNSAASTQLSNAVAIRNATQGVADAQKQQARGAEDSATSIAQAEQRVSDAKRSQQATYENAASSMASAEQRVSDAQRQQEMAQRSLTDARKAAAQQIEDLNRQVSDMAVTEEGASLAVESAQLRLKYALANPLTTDLERRQAAYEVKSANQRLADLQAQDAKTRKAAELANAQGVEGDRQVVQARNSVTTATEAVVNAQQALAKATVDTARQRATADEQVMNAQQALGKATETAGRQQADAAEAVAKAQQALSDTIAQQAAAAAQAAGAHNQFAQAMAKLSPAGQAFVTQLLAMKPLMDGLSKTAQTAMLPGFTKMLQDSGPLFPIFNSGIGAMGKAFSDTALAAGRLFQSPVFQGQLQAAMNNSIPLFKALSDGTLAVFSGFVTLGSQAAPAINGIVGGLHAIGDGAKAFSDAIIPAMGAIGSLTQSTLGIVGALLGPLGDLVAMLAKSLAPAFAELASGALPAFIGVLMSGLRPIIEALGPVLLTLVKAVEKILPAIAPLIPSLGDLIAAFLPIAGVVLDIAADLLVQLSPVIKWLAGFIKSDVVPALTAFGQFLSDNRGPIEVIAALIGAVLLPKLIAVGVEATIAAGKAVAGWVAQSVGAAISAASQVISAGIVAAGWIAMGAEALVQGARIALGWLLAMGPIPIIIAAVVGLAALIITHWDQIAHATEQVWNFVFANVIRPVWDSIKGFIDDRVRDIRGILGWFDGLGGMFDRWFSGAYHGAVDRLNDLVGWIGGLGGRISDAVGDLAYIGKNVAIGLWNGLVSMTSWLYNNVKSWVESTIPAPVRHFLGMNSPSTLMRDMAAEGIAPGIAEGIDAGTPVATAAALRMASAVHGAAAGALGGDGASLNVGVLGSAFAGASTGGGDGGAVAGAAGGGGVHIDNVIVNMQGIVDLHDPFAMSQSAKTMVFQIREALRVTEGQY